MSYKTLNRYNLLLISMLIFFSCKKEGDTPGDPGDAKKTVIVKIVNEYYNRIINVEYDDERKPVAVSSGNLRFWVTKYDARGNITEIRDTGDIQVGYAHKSVISYNADGKIARIDGYELSHPLYPDTTMPSYYAVYAYAGDSIKMQHYTYASPGNYETGDHATRVFYIDASGNIINEARTVNAGTEPYSYSYTLRYSNQIKNPLSLLPKALVFCTSLRYSVFDYLWDANTLSPFVLQTGDYTSISYIAYYGSTATIKETFDYAAEESDVMPGFPARLTQKVYSRFTIQNTGEVIENNFVLPIRFEYETK